MSLIAPIPLLALAVFLGFLGVAIGERILRPLAIVACVLAGVAFLFVASGH